MSRLYRGSDIKGLNQNEFKRGRIEGESYPVWYSSATEDELRESRNAHGIWKYEDEIERREDVYVTGGLTDLLGPAVNFSTTLGGAPGAVIILDRDKVQSEIERIEYDLEWFDAHPGVMAHVSTLYNGEFRANGELYSMMSENDNGWVFYEYGRDRVESRATSPTYQGEREFFTFAESIELGGAVDAVATYGGTTGVSTSTLANYLKEVGMYQDRLGRFVPYDDDKDVIYNEDYRGLAEAVHEAMLDLMEYRPTDYYIVAVDSMNDVGNDPEIERDNFRFVYDGQRFITDYDEVPVLMGVE